MAQLNLQDQVNAVLAGLSKVEPRMFNAVRVAVYQEFVSIMRVSLRQVPVDSGLLRSSAYITLPTTTMPIKIEMGYGTDYAAPVHDVLQARHNPPTKARYLADPFDDRKGTMVARIVQRVKAAYAKGTVSFGPVMPTTTITGRSNPGRFATFLRGSFGKSVSKSQLAKVTSAHPRARKGK